jgi:hypothetical protein
MSDIDGDDDEMDGIIALEIDLPFVARQSETEKTVETMPRTIPAKPNLIKQINQVFIPVPYIFVSVAPHVWRMTLRYDTAYP